MQRPVNGRRDQAYPDLRKLEINSDRGFVGRARDYASAVRIVIALMLILVSPLAAGAETGRSYLEMSGGYKTGDFGTPTKSDLYYVSPTFGYVTPQYDVSVTVPYLYLTNKTGGASTSESGIGDIILRGGRVLLPEDDEGLSLDGSLAIKLPTADENKGLGTGAADYGAFAGLHKRIESVKFSLTGGYIIIGDKPPITYNNIFVYGLGVSKRFKRTEVYTSFEGRQAVIAGAKDPQELHFGFFHILSRDYSLKGSTFFGLNDGGPAFGFELGIVKWF
jgi:hypothetical protein